MLRREMSVPLIQVGKYRRSKPFVLSLSRAAKAFGISEDDWDPGLDLERRMGRRFLATVPGQRSTHDPAM